MHHNASQSKQYTDLVLHDKIFIIDNQTVITGSYSPTAGGDQKNRENVLILHNAGITGQYVEEFERIWQASMLNG